MTASGQAFNVDLQDPGHPIPNTNFGGFVDQVGFWNPWTLPGNGSFGSPATTIDLMPITGPLGTPPVTATTSTSGQASPMASQPGITPSAVEPLYGDYLIGGTVRRVDVNQLLPGDYLVTLYSWRPGGGALWNVQTSLSSPPSQLMSYGLPWPGPYNTPSQSGGDSMVSFAVSVGPGDTLEMRAFCNDDGSGKSGAAGGRGLGGDEPTQNSGGCVLNGFQITPLVGTAYCAQPTNSQGLEMQMIAWGTSVNGAASLSAGDLTLALGVVDSPLPILGTAVLPMVSIDQNPGVTLGCPRIGSLCIGTSSGQNIQLLPAGVAQPDGTFSTGVDFSSLPPAWMIGVGSTLYFQAYYRDFPDPVACPANSFTARLSNALEVMLVP